MTALADRIPVEEISARSGEVRPGRVAMTIVAALGVALGWVVGMFFRSLGWLAGGIWRIAMLFAESVIFGFREVVPRPPPPPPGQ